MIGFVVVAVAAVGLDEEVGEITVDKLPRQDFAKLRDECKRPVRDGYLDHDFEHATKIVYSKRGDPKAGFELTEMALNIMYDQLTSVEREFRLLDPIASGSKHDVSQLLWICQLDRDNCFSVFKHIQELEEKCAAEEFTSNLVPYIKECRDRQILFCTGKTPCPNNTPTQHRHIDLFMKKPKLAHTAKKHFSKLFAKKEDRVKDDNNE